MKPPRLAVFVYLLGMVPLGVFYEQIKTMTGSGWLFILVAVAYLLTLRVLAELVEMFIRMLRQARAEDKQ